MRALRNRNPAPSGFTLIEVLVALAIAAMGLSFLMAAAGTGLENASLADAYLQATVRAQARMAQVGVTIPLKQGNYSGDDGGGFRWQVHIAAPASHGLSGTQGGALGLYPVAVTLHWRSGVLPKYLVLRSERVGRL